MFLCHAVSSTFVHASILPLGFPYLPYRYALNHGAAAAAVDAVNVKDDGKSFFQFSKHSTQKRTEVTLSGDLNCKSSGCVYNLFAFPSECNFSGQRFSLDLVNAVKKDGHVLLGKSYPSRSSWMVLIDAAKGCATDPPDLSKYPADFVVFSFYKIFGYPTGLGALLVRTEAASVLKKTYFAGGTVSASIADADFVKRRDNIEQVFEHGTLSFLEIASIRHGFRIINTLTISAIARHTSSLATYVRNTMMGLKHENGVDLCKVYGSDISQVLSQDIGPTIAFNLKRADGSWVGYREVEKLASLCAIQLRAGCFCNPGACAKYVGLSHSDLIMNFQAGHICWDDNDILHGKPTGAARISFGYMSTFEDAEKFLRFLESSFMVKSSLSEDGFLLNLKSLSFSDNVSQHIGQGIRLKSITVYPVKSCSGFSVSSWPLSSIGLKYDREWLLQGPVGEILTQKKVPEMGRISTSIDLEHGIMYLESPNCKQRLQISILGYTSGHLEEIDVYGCRYEVQTYSDHVNLWFTEAIAQPCTLVRCSSSEYRSCGDTVGRKGFCRDTQSKLSFVNEAQLLLVSDESIGDLNSRLSSTLEKSMSKGPIVVDAMRFRPNLVITGADAYAEDGWRNLCIGKAQFTSLGGCNRCQMVNIDSKSALPKSKEPLATLSLYRRMQGKIFFGILLRFEASISGNGEKKKGLERWLQVGQEVYAS